MAKKAEARLDCEAITSTGNHSDDVLIVYFGRDEEPYRVCGYHEKHYYLRADNIFKMRTARLRKKG